MSHSKAYGDKFTMAAAKRFKVRPMSVTKEQRLTMKREFYAKAANNAKNNEAQSSPAASTDQD